MGNKCCSCIRAGKEKDDIATIMNKERLMLDKLASDLPFSEGSESKRSEGLVLSMSNSDKSDCKVEERNIELKDIETPRDEGGRSEREETDIIDTPNRYSCIDHSMKSTVETIVEVEDDKENILMNLNSEQIRSPEVTNDISSMNEFGEEEDTVGEMIPSIYDQRPIRPLPTPLRMVDITPSRNIESFCDGKGRVRRNEKILKYFDGKRRSYEVNGS